jgi:hypothetical protein
MSQKSSPTQSPQKVPKALMSDNAAVEIVDGIWAGSADLRVEIVSGIWAGCQRRSKITPFAGVKMHHFGAAEDCP